MSMVMELRNDITNNKLTIKEIVRKAYVMAKLLKLDDVIKWLDYEMNGYDQNADVPDYRNIKGTFRMVSEKKINYEDRPKDYNIYIFKISIYLLEQKLQYINELTQHNRYIIVSNKYTNLLQKQYPSLNPYIKIYGNSIYNMLERIKDNVLRLTLDLENQGILGENMTFTKEEEEKAKAIPQIINNIINNYGHNSNIQTGGTDNTIKSNNDFTVEKQGE